MSHDRTASNDRGTASALHLQPLEFEVDESPHVIPHDKAYRHTKTTVEEMTKAMDDYRRRGGKHLLPPMKDAVLAGMQSLIDEWSEQMAEYETLKSGRATLSLHSLRELPATLVKARIAAGLSQKQLAERMGVKPQQIQRYEATRYRTITLARMLAIAEALHVRIDARVELGEAQ